MSERMVLKNLHVLFPLNLKCNKDKIGQIIHEIWLRSNSMVKDWMKYKKKQDSSFFYNNILYKYLKSTDI